MTDLDDLLSAHVRDLQPAGPPPLAVLRSRATGRRRRRVLSAAVIVGALSAGAVLLPRDQAQRDAVVPADGAAQVLLEVADLEQTYGGAWEQDGDPGGVYVSAGCGPGGQPREDAVLRTFTRPDVPVRAASQVERYPDAAAARLAFGERIDAVEECQDVPSAVYLEPGLVAGPGLLGDPSYAFGQLRGDPDTWFVFFAEGADLVSASITTPDSDEEQAVAAVSALAERARAAATD